MKIPFALIAAHARRTWLRTLLTVISVFIAVLIYASLQTFLASMTAMLDDTNPSRLVTQSGLGLFAHLPKRLEPELRQFPHVEEVAALTWFGGVYLNEDPKHLWGRFGVDVPAFRKVYESDMILGDAAWKRFAETRTACIIGATLAEKERFKVGDVVPLTGNIFPGRLEVQVAGIYESRNLAFDESTLYMHWDYMNEVSKGEGGRRDVVSVYALLLDGPSHGPAVAQQIDASYENSDTRTWTLTERAFQQQFTSMWGNVPLYFKVLGTVVLVACLMVTANTMVLNARERVQEVGVLKTLGFKPSTLAITTILEGLLLCLIGGILALALVRSVDGEMVMFTIMSVPSSVLLTGLGLSALLGLLSGAIPAWIASRMDIVQAIRRRA